MIELSSSIMFGPREGNTNASTCRVLSPSVSSKRTYPKILRGDLRLIAPVGTGKISVYFIVGCVWTKLTEMHGTSVAVSMVTIVRRMIIDSGVYSYAFRRRV